MIKDRSFFDGAIMAYNDAAEFAEHIADDMPDECKPIFSEIIKVMADGFRNKAKNVDLLVAGTEEVTQ